MKTRGFLATGLMAAAFVAAAILTRAGCVKSIPPKLPEADLSSVKPLSSPAGNPSVKAGDRIGDKERRAERERIDWQSVIDRKARQPIQASGVLPQDEPLSPEDRRLLDAIDQAYDAEDLTSVRALASRARSSPSRSVREAFIWALGWFGPNTLEDLMPFISDADEEIAKDAYAHWTEALQELDDEVKKVSFVERLMTEVTDKEMLDEIALEYLGIDDALAVQSLLRLINSETAERTAREIYEMVTGEPYTTDEAAQNWIRNFAQR